MLKTTTRLYHLQVLQKKWQILLSQHTIGQATVTGQSLTIVHYMQEARQLAHELEAQHSAELAKQQSELQQGANAQYNVQMQQVQQGYADQIGAANGAAARWAN